MNHIFRFDKETEPEEGMLLASQKIAAEVPEANARNLVTRIAMLILMLSYIEKKGLATEEDKKNLSIFKECFAASSLPEIKINLA